MPPRPFLPRTRLRPPHSSGNRRRPGTSPRFRKGRQAPGNSAGLRGSPSPSCHHAGLERPLHPGHRLPDSQRTRRKDKGRAGGPRAQTRGGASRGGDAQCLPVAGTPGPGARLMGGAGRARRVSAGPASVPGPAHALLVASALPVRSRLGHFTSLNGDDGCERPEPGLGAGASGFGRRGSSRSVRGRTRAGTAQRAGCAQACMVLALE